MPREEVVRTGLAAAPTGPIEVLTSERLLIRGRAARDAGPSLRSCSERRLVRLPDRGHLRVAGTDCQGHGATVNAINLVGLILAILVTIFLVIALLFPEKF